MNGFHPSKNLYIISIMNIHYTPENTFIFSFVRMNPPTLGHL